MTTPHPSLFTPSDRTLWESASLILPPHAGAQLVAPALLPTLSYSTTPPSTIPASPTTFTLLPTNPESPATLHFLGLSPPPAAARWAAWSALPPATRATTDFFAFATAPLLAAAAARDLWSPDDAASAAHLSALGVADQTTAAILAPAHRAVRLTRPLAAWLRDTLHARHAALLLVAQRSLARSASVAAPLEHALHVRRPPAGEGVRTLWRAVPEAAAVGLKGALGGWAGAGLGAAVGMLGGVEPLGEGGGVGFFEQRGVAEGYAAFGRGRVGAVERWVLVRMDVPEAVLGGVGMVVLGGERWREFVFPGAGGEREEIRELKRAPLVVGPVFAVGERAVEEMGGWGEVREGDVLRVGGEVAVQWLFNADAVKRVEKAGGDGVKIEMTLIESGVSWTSEVG